MMTFIVPTKEIALFKPDPYSTMLHSTFSSQLLLYVVSLYAAFCRTT